MTITDLRNMFDAVVVHVGLVFQKGEYTDSHS